MDIQRLFRSQFRSLSLCGITLLLLVSACQKEINGDITQAVTDSCRLIRLEEGADTVLTLYYDNAGKVTKITDFDRPSNYTDSILVTYDASGHPAQLFWDSPFPLYQKIQYSGQQIASVFLIDPIFSDTTEYEYEYSSGFDKPARSNLYSYSSGRSLYQYNTYDYNADGDIIRKQTFSPAGDLVSTIQASYTSLPNSFSLIGGLTAYFNIYNEAGSQFVESWWNTHNLQSFGITFPHSEYAGGNLEYDLDSTGRVTAMKSTITGSLINTSVFHYSFYYECQ